MTTHPVDPELPPDSCPTAACQPSIERGGPGGFPPAQEEEFRCFAPGSYLAVGHCLAAGRWIQHYPRSAGPFSALFAPGRRTPGLLALKVDTVLLPAGWTQHCSRLVNISCCRAADISCLSCLPTPLLALLAPTRPIGRFLPQGTLATYPISQDLGSASICRAPIIYLFTW